LIYMADGKAADGIPMLKLCPEVKARKVSGQHQFSFMITQGDFLVGGVREGVVDIEPGKAQVLPSLSGENKKGFGLISIEGQGRCVVGIVTGKRSAILGEKVSIKGTKLVDLYEGDSWFAVAPNPNLSAKEFVLEEEKIKKNDELRNLHLQKKSLSKKKRIALMNSGTRRTWVIKGAGDRPQLVQTQACPRTYLPIGRSSSGDVAWPISNPRGKGYSYKEEEINEEDPETLSCPAGSYKVNYFIDGVYGTHFGVRALKVANHCSATVGEFNGIVQVSSCCNDLMSTQFPPGAGFYRVILKDGRIDPRKNVEDSRVTWLVGSSAAL
jgi:hypothetical protein